MGIVRRVVVCIGAVAACGLATAAPAPGVATTVARPGASTGVREYGGTIAFSSFDHGDGRWYLSIRKAGRSAQRLPVSPSPTPFRADIGTDSAGRPELIYQRCALTTRTVMVGTMPMTTTSLTGCDLYVYALAAGGGERPVRNANDQAHSDVGATLWNGRIAWTREYGSGTSPNDVIYTKTLTAPRSQRSKRLPGAPPTRCGDVDPVCGPTTHRSVGTLELSGDDLAVVVDYTCTGCSGIAQSELRLDAVRTATSRRVASIVVGLNGQALVGPSFFSGRLAWYRACAVTDPSCKPAAGPWRSTLSTGRYQRASGPIRMPGFADTGSRLYEVLGCTDAQAGAQYNANCRIDEVTPPAYAAAPAPVR